MKAEKRTERIRQLIKRLNSGVDVTNSALARVLSPEQYGQMLARWEFEKGERKLTKPIALKKYEAMLKIGLLHWSKMESYHSAGKATLATQFSLKADHAFEEAQLFLEEAVQIDADLLMWIDRPLSDTSNDPIGMPRVIGSESFECQNKAKSPYPTLTKRQIKLQSLELALEAMEPANFAGFCEAEKIVHFGKKAKINTSGFKF